MEIQVSEVRGVPVLALSGRLDGAGAARFDEAAAALGPASPFCVLDVSGVSYLSSVGIRSLVAIEKTLRARDGGVVLTGLTPFVRQLLDMSGLTSRLRLAPGVPEAIELAQAGTASAPAATQRLAGRTARVRRLAPGLSCAEWWQGAPLVSATVADLGFAVGVGGFGATESDARAGLGRFVSTPILAGLVPDDGDGAADFMAGPHAAAMPLHVAHAAGFAGVPAFVVELGAPEAGAVEPFVVADVVADLFALATPEAGTPPSTLGIVAIGEGVDGQTTVAVALAFDPQAARAGFDPEGRLEAETPSAILPTGRALLGGAIRASGAARVDPGADLALALGSLGRPDGLHAVTALDRTAPFARAALWVFVPDVLRGGAEKLLQVTVEGGGEWRPEWDGIVRRLYADCRSVTLTPLHGGYMSKTFRAVAYDGEGRRTLPTVLKIGPTALTAREEQANRQYVARFILNNGTTVLGGAEEGGWAGLRYNFLGVTGPETQLVWLRQHYLTGDTDTTMALFDRLVTQVLKPWYAQPKWEQVWLYRDHTPLRLFPDLLETAEAVLGVSADSPTFACPELGCDLPNPFHFLKYEFPRRASVSRLWYTTICHGDLNMQNVLVDERENLYVIDFSETRPRNAVSDFARVEPIAKFELPRLESDEDLRHLLEFEAGLMSVRRIDEAPPLIYRGADPLVPRAHALITRLRRWAGTVTLFEQDPVPYWLALLEWTYPVVCYVQLSARHKRYAACSAALICRSIQELEAGA